MHYTYMYSCNTRACIITRDSLFNEVPCFRLDLLQHGVIQLSNNILVPYSEVDHQTKVVHLWSGRVCVCVCGTSTWWYIHAAAW